MNYCRRRKLIRTAKHYRIMHNILIKDRTQDFITGCEILHRAECYYRCANRIEKLITKYL